MGEKPKIETEKRRKRFFLFAAIVRWDYPGESWA